MNKVEYCKAKTEKTFGIRKKERKKERKKIFS